MKICSYTGSSQDDISLPTQRSQLSQNSKHLTPGHCIKMSDLNLLPQE